MIIGFTGSRTGMTPITSRMVAEIVRMIKDHAPCTGLHGDCIGADADFDQICKDAGMVTKIRPCTFESMRANCDAEEIAEPMAPMQRNRDIVGDADVMIACPPNFEEIKRGSGTWATIKFTRRAEKPLYIVYPDGSIAQERVLKQPEVLGSGNEQD